MTTEIIHRNPFPAQAEPVRVICPTTGKAFTAHRYGVTETTAQTYLWIPCPFCDDHRRTADDPLFDPSVPQPHCVTADEVTYA